jgi:predicted nuclease with TOPRIM domain
MNACRWRCTRTVLTLFCALVPTLAFGEPDVGPGPEGAKISPAQATAPQVAALPCCPSRPHKQVITDVVVLIDSTSSMAWSAVDLSRLAIAQWCALDAADAVPDELPAAFVKLEDSASTIRQLSPLAGDGRSKLRLAIMQLRPVGEGKLEKLFEEAKHLLPPDGHTVPLIVVVTDGIDCDPHGAGVPLRDLRNRFGEDRLHLEIIGICDSSVISAKLSDLAQQAGVHGHFSSVKSYLDLPAALTETRALLRSVLLEREAEAKWCLEALACCLREKSKLEIANRELHDKLEHCHEEKVKLEREKTKLEIDVKVLQEKLKCCEEEKARLEAEIRELHERLKHCHEVDGKLEGDIKVLDVKLKHTEEVKVALEVERKELHEKLKQSHEVEGKLEGDIKILHEKLKCCDDAKCKVEGENKELHEKLKCCHEANAKLEGKVRELCEKLKCCDEAKCKLEAEIKELRDRLKACDEAKGKLEGEKKELERTVGELTGRADHLWYVNVVLLVVLCCAIVAILFLLFALLWYIADRARLQADVARLAAEVIGATREMAANKKDCCCCKGEPSVVYGPITTTPNGPVTTTPNNPTTTSPVTTTDSSAPTVTPITPSTPVTPVTPSTPSTPVTPVTAAPAVVVSPAAPPVVISPDAPPVVAAPSAPAVVSAPSGNGGGGGNTPLVVAVIVLG